MSSMNNTSNNSYDNYGYLSFSTDELLPLYEKCIIAVYDNQNKKNILLISDIKEIQNYREIFEKLSRKKSKAIQSIFNNIKVNILLHGWISLKQYQEMIEYEINEKKILSKSFVKGKSKITDKSMNTTSNNTVFGLNYETVQINTKTPDCGKKIQLENIEPKKYCVENITEFVTEKQLNTNNIENDSKLVLSEKILKKKMKKQKQKEKKLENKGDHSSSSSVVELELKKNTKMKGNKNNEKLDHNELIKKKSENLKNSVNEININYDDNSFDLTNNYQTEETSSSDGNTSFLDSENRSKFYIEYFKREQKYIEKEESEQTLTKKEETHVCLESEDDFFIQSKKRIKNISVSKNDAIKSEKWAKKSLNMIMKNRLLSALDYLHKALSLNPTDHRHYLNRCYCYLRLEKNKDALEDAQYVIQNSKVIGYIFIANLRAGQALFALKKYQQAEVYLKEAMNLSMDNLRIKTELIYIQIKRLVQEGNNEIDAFFALDLYPSTMEAMKYLNKKSLKTKLVDNINNFNDDYENVTYMSDDDELHITNLLIDKTGYKPGLPLQHIVQPFWSCLQPVVCDHKNGEIKSLPGNKIIVDGKNIQGTTIWMGSLNTSITNSMIKKELKQFGNIISMYRPSDKTYCFINFEKSESVMKILSNIKSIKIGGFNLPIRPAHN